jgi:ferric-dicitrate binding protein FerR (iron transport regulator)
MRRGRHLESEGKDSIRFAMRKVAFRNATICLLCLASLVAHAASRSAVAIVMGDVSVNGNSVSRSTPVFEGDRLRLGTNAGVLLHLRGATVQLSSNTDVRYRGEQLELASGTLQIRGTEAIVSGPFTIEAAGDAQFRIERNGAQTRVAVLEGKVKVRRGKNLVMVEDRSDHVFSDDEPVVTARKSALPKEVAAGASGGAAGAAVTNWMNGRKKQGSVSRKSPAEP